MQKIIVDTNVLVSALIQYHYPFKIVVEIFSNEEIQLCLSDELFAEYFNVLNRKKFAKFPDFMANSQALLVDIEKIAIKYFPLTRVEIISDPDDNKLLELAEISQADFLITGNTNDFKIHEYKGTKIVSPKEYWTEYMKSPSL
ncbi:MAG: putative toxin-antitoxin system toxin component, PIN family [Bacteroidetes bacterium]|nr:putative toxin-antitoxin system toxin component, PIN family [Bacteroidota bacterium]